MPPVPGPTRGIASAARKRIVGALHLSPGYHLQPHLGQALDVLALSLERRLERIDALPPEFLGQSPVFLGRLRFGRAIRRRDCVDTALVLLIERLAMLLHAFRQGLAPFFLVGTDLVLERPPIDSLLDNRRFDRPPIHPLAVQFLLQLERRINRLAILVEDLLEHGPSSLGRGNDETLSIMWVLPFDDSYEATRTHLWRAR